MSSKARVNNQHKLTVRAGTQSVRLVLIISRKGKVEKCV